MPRFELWQHPDSRRWYVTWTERGRSKRATTHTTDRGDAERFRAAFVLERDKPVAARPDDVPLSAVLDSYYERHAKRLPSEEQARISIAHLKGFYGASTVAAVTPNSHDRYRAICEDEGSSPGTINRRRAVLRAALRRAVKRGDLAQAPFVPVEAEPEPEAPALTRDQMAAWLRTARRLNHHHTALFARIAVYTGARASAIVQVNKRRVDPETGVIDFRLPGNPHKRKRRAVTALPAKLRPALTKALADARSGHLIEYRGKPVKRLKRSIGAVSAACGMPWVTAHTFKHTAVTWGLRVASPWMVAGMTATSLRTLQRVYGKHMVSDLRAVAEAVAHSRPRNLRVSTKSPVSGKPLE